jgi:argininosuccinate lyase
MKSLPLAYNRDMQEDKPPLFAAVDTLTSCLEIYIEMLPAIKFNKPTMQRAAENGFLDATDLADYLASRGMPFREAHRLVGEAVGFALSREKELHELTLEQLQSFSPLIQDDIFSCLAPRQMIDQRTSYGGTAANVVGEALSSAEELLSQKEKMFLNSRKFRNPAV